jgi:putative transposase
LLDKLIEPLLNAAYPPSHTGRPRSCFRIVLNGIIYRMRSGVQWNELPEKFGDDSTVHRWFQRWGEDEIFEKIWAIIAAACEDLGGLEWGWQSVDGRMGKARFGGDKIGKNPTDRGKPGSKISLAVEGSGGPQ